MFQCTDTHTVFISHTVLIGITQTVFNAQAHTLCTYHMVWS